MAGKNMETGDLLRVCVWRKKYRGQSEDKGDGRGIFKKCQFSFKISLQRIQCKIADRVPMFNQQIDGLMGLNETRTPNIEN